MSTYKKHVANGCCGRCGEQRPATSKALCDKCRVLSQQRAADRREKANNSALCSSCCSRPRVTARTRCEQCLTSSAASARRAKQQCKLNGICQSCGKCPPMTDKTICSACSERMSALSSAKYHERRAEGKCSYCNSDPVGDSTMCQHHIDQTKQHREDLKLEVMNAYGGPSCAWCAEKDIRYLEFDRINGGGQQHGIEHACGSGHGLRCWLKANNFPPGFRILCRTCNNKSRVERCRENGKNLNQSTAPDPVGDQKQ